MSKPEALRSNLDLVTIADEYINFLISQRDPDAWLTAWRLYCHLFVDGIHSPVGMVHPNVVEAIRHLSGWKILDSEEAASSVNSITVLGDDEPSRSKIVANTLAHLRDANKFGILSRWRNEVEPVYGPDTTVLFSVERAAASVFGIVHIWISTRSQTTANYAGMLDNTMAGGYRTGEDPIQTVIREAEEEASMPADLVRLRARSCGTISNFHYIDKYVKGEKYLAQTEVEYLYEVETPPDFVEISCRLHRTLEFPTMRGS
ncbi:hypothetical protein QBC35DRAFT_478849 [Podospora australis]|uniref:DUF4743 domain-containing protein n=1 Tax=Podospora australis TaxID=1536484 RepID=A0AAN7ADL4_9PEZI|nr:hypothetical protein QBC35DRAFT_478849 [Podospora australis]